MNELNYHTLGKTGYKISELSFGTWAIGGAWGKTNDEESLRALEIAIEKGVNFFDTADVYGDGHSEELLREATKGKEDEIYVASKFCRKGDIHDPDNYSKEAVTNYLNDTLKRLGRDTLDLYQIHCPPLEILQEGSVFRVLDDLKAAGKIRHYGVSIETVEEGLYLLENEPGVSTLQVIFNMMRQKPLDELFPKAVAKNVGIIARLPLASGLLTGKFNKNHTFESDDHRNFNKDGEAFNVGETFGGLPFETGVELANKLNWIADDHGDMAQAALKWIMQQPGVSTVIPGFKNTKQVKDNLGSVAVKDFTEAELNRLRDFYQEEIHQHIRGPY
ncbi:aryl-alcohol dehydrogenase-like predicted oxidoreductase [Streptohalobacillus salinus]|uniref:Aryl-alcohol dehydrogenase-like predicted oxidoreductase n=1 Tax=Streptohalobacillus salinus TaxID=621096 RepID=A0A2V3W524_9BACI|nr:aryl-alcohol dehydrogenase-like predicted oxidoreductase [Streptohalobacillus salinus]